MAHLNAYSEGNHCLSRNHGDRRCMFLFKLSQCALFQLEFVSAAYYLWQHMHCKIITRSNYCISHSFTCLRKHKVNDSVCANFQEKRCFSKCTILIINPWAHSECMYIPFLIFTAYITISVKCKLTWVILHLVHSGWEKATEESTQRFYFLPVSCKRILNLLLIRSICILLCKSLQTPFISLYSAREMGATNY